MKKAVNECWGTPQGLFDELDREFRFTLDAAASKENAKCSAFYTKADNALALPWSGRVWVNPPYGRAVGAWIGKGWRECVVDANAELVVMLVKATTDTQWFHAYVWDNDVHRSRPRCEVRFIKGRVAFVIPGQKSVGAPFSSMLVIFRRGW